MKLPDLHRRLLTDALTCGSAYGLVLAGGYAVQAHDRSGMEEIVHVQVCG
ncbi:hypothetical protein ACIPSA_46180 [Streptomyces sp. NPDC086549]